MLPAIQLCPPLGEINIREPFIVKVALLTSNIVGDNASTIFIIQFVELIFGKAAQVKDPEEVLYEVAIAI